MGRPKKIQNIEKESNVDIKVKKMNVSKMSNEDIQDLFTQAFDNQVASYNGIDNFECECTKENGKIIVEVTISGFAGSPCVDDFKSSKVKNCESVKIEEDNGVLEFGITDKISSLTATEYVVTYQAI